MQLNMLQSSTSSEIAYSTTGPNDWIANGSSLQNKKAEHIVNAYLLNLTLTAYQQAQMDLLSEGKIELKGYISPSVKIDYTKSNDIITGDYGILEFNENYTLSNAKAGYSGEYAYIYKRGNVIKGNSLFGSYKKENLTKRIVSEGLFIDYYMIEFYSNQKWGMGSLLFKERRTYENFVNHYKKRYNHFRQQILQQNKN